MRNGLLFSAVFHIGIFLLVFFGLPIFQKPREVVDQPIVLEMVTIAEKSNPRPSTQPREEARPTPARPPEPEVAKPVPPPPPPPPQPQVAERAPTPAPRPPEPAPQARPEPIPAPKPEAKKEPPKPEPPKPAPPVAQQTPPRKPQPPAPPKEDFIASVLKNIAPVKPQPTQPTNQPARPNPQPSPPPAPPSLDQQVTRSEIDAVRDQIAQCWNVPSGARGIADMVVTIRANVGPDGRVTRAEIVSTARMNDPFYSAAAESARRAALNPACQPLKLPPHKYDQWRVLELNFNPKDMIG